LKRTMGWMYKFWIFQTLHEFNRTKSHEMFQSDTTNEDIAEAFWRSEERVALEKILQKWLVHDGSIVYRIKRSYKWQMLASIRRIREDFLFGKFTWFKVFLRMYIDFKTSRYLVKR